MPYGRRRRFFRRRPFTRRRFIRRVKRRAVRKAFRKLRRNDCTMVKIKRVFEVKTLANGIWMLRFNANGRLDTSSTPDTALVDGDPSATTIGYSFPYSGNYKDIYAQQRVAAVKFKYIAQWNANEVSAAYDPPTSTMIGIKYDEDGVEKTWTTELSNGIQLFLQGNKTSTASLQRNWSRYFKFPRRRINGHQTVPVYQATVEATQNFAGAWHDSEKYVGDVTNENGAHISMMSVGNAANVVWGQMIMTLYVMYRDRRS